jgi:hypothetical protein
MPDELITPPNSQNPPVEPPSTVPPVTPVQPVGTGISTGELEQLLQRARKEEKDKLYPELSQLKEKDKANASLVKELEQKLVDANKASEVTGSLKTEIDSLKTEIAKLKEVPPVTTQPTGSTTEPVVNSEIEALRKQLEEQSTVLKSAVETIAGLQTATQKATATQIRQNLIAEKGSDIYPEFQDLIVGNTPEEVEASMTAIRSKQQAIYQRASSQAVSIPPANPEAQMNFGELTPDQIQNMSMEDWAKHRKQLIPNAR